MLVDPRGVGKITFLASGSKIGHLRDNLATPPAQLDLGGRAPVELELLERKPTGDRPEIDRIVSRIKAGAVGGAWDDDSEPHSGTFVEAVMEAVREDEGSIRLVDAWPGVARATVIKDTKDINAVRSACSIVDVVFKKFLLPKLEEVVDAGKKANPVKLGEYVDGYFLAPEKISAKLQANVVESCYVPIFSSAPRLPTDLTKYEPENKPLDFSIIVCALGARYRSLCANLVRTVLINPSAEVTAAYAALLAAFAAAVKAITPGASLGAPFAAAKRALAERDAALADSLELSVGHSMGIEFCELQQLSAAASGTFEAGWTLNVMVVLQNVHGGHAMALGDTVLVAAGGPSEVLTKYTKDGLQYDLEERAESDGDEDVMRGTAAREGVAGKRKSRMRDTSALTSEMELKQKQKENFERLQAELAKRAEEGDTLGGAKVTEGADKDWLTVNAYPNGAKGYPAEATPYRLAVDAENDTLLVPVHGFVVPIHISLIKTVTKLDDTIRFQLKVPGKGKQSASANRIVEEFPNTVWIKEIVYHLKNASILSSIDRSIKEMRKRVTAAEKRKADMTGLEEQDPLQLSREKAPVLQALFVRPSLAGKRVVGNLEAHRNGFRYTSNKGQKLDVLYNNIAHAFFQPAEQEMLVIIHFRLRFPIVVGKRKTIDVQFVQETMEASSRLDARRRNYGDADEIEEEAREKVARKKINREFFKFCKDVEEFCKRNDDGEDVIKFDFPSRELGFTGVPFKSNVLLQPTAQDCLVHLVEGPPFFVLSLQDVEVASFERVQFGLRQFDLIFVLKDYSKDPIAIGSIPVEALETLQEWLTKSEVLFYLNPQPYNWSMIMSEVRAKTLKEFLAEGGWSFLGKDPSEEEGGEGESDGEPSEGEDAHCGRFIPLMGIALQSLRPRKARASQTLRTRMKWTTATTATQTSPRRAAAKRKLMTGMSRRPSWRRQTRKSGTTAATTALAT